jgi:ABC-type oligopeptide transport system ATPase subunit
MQEGRIVETLQAHHIVSGKVQHPYTRELLANAYHAPPATLPLGTTAQESA